MVTEQRPSETGVLSEFICLRDALEPCMGLSEGFAKICILGLRMWTREIVVYYLGHQMKKEGL